MSHDVVALLGPLGVARSADLTSRVDRHTIGSWVAAEALAAVRKAKSEAKQSMRADVASATVTAPEVQVALVEAARRDLTAAGRIESLTVVAGDGPLTVDVVLAETPDA